MRDRITTTAELGELIRAVRKAGGVRMDHLPDVGPVFVRHIERGKDSAQIGKVLSLLTELGIRLEADVPDHTESALKRLREKAALKQSRKAP